MKKVSTKEAAIILKKGGVVVFPTDTVWGVGAHIDSNIGLEKLYKIKNREEGKPTAVLVGSMKQAQMYGIFDNISKNLIKKHWPGALTIIVPAKDGINNKILNKTGGIGIRLPGGDLIKNLCGELDGGIVASSANFAGKQPPMIVEDVSEELMDLVDGVVYMSEQPHTRAGMVHGVDAKSSTVVDCMNGEVKVIRQGDVWV